MKREFARWLIQHAARSAPPELAERLEEEWLADLESRAGRMARLRFGLGCNWATKVIAHEYNAQEVLAAASAAGSRTMAAYANHDDPFFSRRTIMLLAIVGLHAIVIYALATGLASKVVKALPPDLTGVVIQPAPKHYDPPPDLRDPQLTHPRVFVPPTVDRFDFPPDSDGIKDVTTEVLPPQQPQRATSTVPIVKRVLGGPGKGFPNTEDYYPPSQIRAHQEGAVTVNTCVDERGRLTQAPAVAESSGTTGLDEAALRLAKAGSGRYRPSTENGQPVSSCYSFRIRFKMKD